MEITEEVKNKYSKIKMFIPMIEKTQDPKKIIETWSFKIDAKNDFETSKQWIKYVSEKDGFIALELIDKFKYLTEEQREEIYIEVIGTFKDKISDEKALKSLMILFLKTHNFDKANILYKYTFLFKKYQMNPLEITTSVENTQVLLKRILEQYNIIFEDNTKSFFEETFTKTEQEEQSEKQQMLKNFKAIEESNAKLKDMEIEPIELDELKIGIETDDKNLCIRQIGKVRKRLYDLLEYDNPELDRILVDINRNFEEIKTICLSERRIIQELIGSTDENNLDLINQFDDTNNKILELLYKLNARNKYVEQLEDYKREVLDVYLIFFNYYRLIKASFDSKELWEEFITQYLKDCKEYRTEEELQNVKDFQNSILELEKILNKNHESPEIEIEKQKCTSKLLLYKKKVLHDYEKEKDILRNAEKTGEISKKDYDWIRKYLSNIKIRNDFQEIKDETIKLDDELRYKIGKAVLQIRKYNSTQTYEHYMNTKIPPLEQKNILNIFSIGNTIEKIIRREEKYGKHDEEIFKKLRNEKNKMEEILEEKLSEGKTYTRYRDFLMSKDEKLARLLKPSEIFKGPKYINNSVIDKLLEASDYDTILDFISVVDNNDDFLTIFNSIKKIRNIIIDNHTDKIKSLVKEMIGRNHYYYALHILKCCNAKKYMDYLPQDKTPMDYLEEIKGDYVRASIIIQKELFAEAHPELNGIECSKAWLKHIDSYEELHTSEIKSQIQTVIELLISDFCLLEDEYIKEKIEYFRKNSQDYIKSLPVRLYKNAKDLMNKIILETHTNKELISKLKQISGINLFEYLENEIEPMYDRMEMFAPEMTAKSKELLNRILSEKDLNTEELVYIYMNTYMRVTIGLEEFIPRLLENNCENIYEELNKYKFYINIWLTKNKRKRVASLLNVKKIVDIPLENSTTNLLGNTYKKVYTVTIQSFDKFQNCLCLSKIREISMPEEETAEVEQIENDEEQNTRPTNRLEWYMFYYEEDKVAHFERLKEFSLNGEELERFIQFQIDLLPKLTSTVEEKLFKDTINPYRYKNYKFLLQCKPVKQKEQFEKISFYREFATKLKKKYAKIVKEEYIKLLRTNNIELLTIIKYYFNTSTRYFLALEDFIKLIANIRFNDKKIVFLSKYFQYFPILFSNTTEDVYIVDMSQIVTRLGDKKYIKYVGDTKKIKEKNQFKRAYFCIDTYDKEKQEITTKNFDIVDLYVNSNAFKKMMKSLNSYAKIGNISILDNFDNFPVVPEFDGFNNFEFAQRRDIGLLEEYKQVYYEATKKALDNNEENIDNLKIFVEKLGNNNYWSLIKDTVLYSGWFVDTKRNDLILIRDMFLDKIKNADLETVLYCYENTFLKNLISIEEILKTVLIYNKNYKNKVDSEGFFDLAPYNIEIVGVVKKDEMEFNTIPGKLNIVIPNLEITEDRQRVDVILEKVKVENQIRYVLYGKYIKKNIISKENAE